MSFSISFSLCFVFIFWKLFNLLKVKGRCYRFFRLLSIWINLFFFSFSVKNLAQLKKLFSSPNYYSEKKFQFCISKKRCILMILFSLAPNFCLLLFPQDYQKRLYLGIFLLYSKITCKLRFFVLKEYQYFSRKMKHIFFRNMCFFRVFLTSRIRTDFEIKFSLILL